MQSIVDIIDALLAIETCESSAKVYINEVMTVLFNLRSSFFRRGISSNSSGAIGRD